MPTKTTERPDGLPSSEHVYRALKEEILSGTLEPDTRVVELAVAARYGVSRTPVREALKRLEAENLLVADPGRGMVVPRPKASEIEDMFVIREVLDGLAARLAARRITSSELGRLRVIIDSMSEGVQNGRRQQVMAANTRFHDVIYEAAGIDALERIARDLRDYVLRYSTLPFASPERVEDVLAEHRAIIDALERSDPDAAEAASRSHLAAAREYLVRLQLREYAESVLS